jgi:drug/metabolite transporter (DMT)-like permease
LKPLNNDLPRPTSAQADKTSSPEVNITGIYFLLVGGVFAASSAVIWIKLSSLDPYLLSAYRLLGAALLLLPVFFLAWRRARERFTLGRLFRRAVVPGFLLALHFITWVDGARRTDAANASLIVNLVVVAMPFFLWFVLREGLNRREWVGTGFAVLGVIILGVGDYHLAPENLIGDLVCFLSMLLYAGYLVAGRTQRDLPSLWLYVVPLYAVGGLICLGFGLAAGSRPEALPLNETLILLALILIPTLLGHTGINLGLKYIRGQVVGLFNLLQFVFAGIMAYFILREVPIVAFYPAALSVILGVVVVLGLDRAILAKFRRN